MSIYDGLVDPHQCHFRIAPFTSISEGCSVLAEKPLDLLFISTVTLAEIRFGIELVADAGKRAGLHDWLNHEVRPMFGQRILHISEDVLLKWCRLVEDRRKIGHTYSQPDLFIAAIALQHGLTIVSRDASEFEKARAPVVNPWNAA